MQVELRTDVQVVGEEELYRRAGMRLKMAGIPNRLGRSITNSRPYTGTLGE